jgi:hypothetical protein
LVRTSLPQLARQIGACELFLKRPSRDSDGALIASGR